MFRAFTQPLFLVVASKKKLRTTHEVGASSQAPQHVSQTSQTSINTRNRGNIPNPYSLTHLEHIARYNILSCELVIATRYYDKDLLTRLVLLDDICWLFSWSYETMFRD